MKEKKENQWKSYINYNQIIHIKHMLLLLMGEYKKIHKLLIIM